MNLALLGVDDSTWPVVRAAAASDRHHVVWACETDAHADRLREVGIASSASPAATSQPWETLLDEDVADAVIVAGGEAELRAEQLRKLAQAGVPMLIAHPISPSMLLAHELDMIRRETACVMVPYIPARWHAEVARLRQWIASGEAGEIEQAVFDRRLADRGRANVLLRFALDVDLLRMFCGELTKISALGPGHDEAQWLNLGVQLSGPSRILARWSLGPVEEGEASQLKLQGSRHSAVLHLPAEESQWRAVLGEESKEARQDPGRESADGLASAHAALDALQQAIDGGNEGTEVRPHWTDAARSIELADTIERCLKKQRVIELHLEDHTEQATFKGTMTSLGCAVMLVALLLTVLASMAGRLGRATLKYLPHLVLVLLLLFLGLQLFRFVFPNEAEGKSEQ